MAADAIYTLYKAGILQGSDAIHSAKPNDNIKRNEVTAILTRMMDKDERLLFTLGAEVEPEIETQPLKITTHPTGANVSTGAEITISVEVSGGTTPYKYDWFVCFEDVGIYDWPGVSLSNNAFTGMDTSKLTFDTTGFENRACKTYCEITDADNKKVKSNEASIIINEARTVIHTKPGIHRK